MERKKRKKRIFGL
uniref:Uncharacterized protein n=1 Tax=Lactococcus garvieae TaxID=1363 RepID=F8WLE4_9LACT|nr:incomplete conserved hypothetical protein [Lactococcus garvieae]